MFLDNNSYSKNREENNKHRFTKHEKTQVIIKKTISFKVLTLMKLIMETAILMMMKLKMI